MSDKNIDKEKEFLEQLEEFKQQLINSIESIQKGTGCDEGFSYTCFGEGDIEQALKIIEELETYKKIAQKLVDSIVSDKKILALTCKHIINKTEDECLEQNCLCDECIIDWARKEVEKDEC